MPLDGQTLAHSRLRTAMKHVAGGDEATALAELTDAISCGALPPRLETEAVLERGKLHYLQGKQLEAIADFKSVLNSSDSDVSQRETACGYLANCFEELGEPPAEIQMLEQAVHLGAISNRQAAVMLHNFGVRCNLRGTPEKGFVYFTAVCSKEPSASRGVFCNALINRGCHLGSLGHLGMAEDDFRRAIAFPGIPGQMLARAFFNLANAYCLVPEYDSAIACFSRVIDSAEAPEKLRLLAKCKRAHSYQRSGHHEIAQRLIRELLAIPRVEPQDDYETLLFYSGATLLDCRQYLEAEKLLTQLITLRNGSAEIKTRAIWSLGYCRCRTSLKS